MTTTPTSIAASQETQFQRAALEWYAANGRDLAFRRTTDPWAVLVSEVMAQQTQASRAAEAWSRFIERYPTPVALAATSRAEVIRAWRGLGYNRRAVALHAAAVRMVQDHGGRVPDSLEALEALPGIGPYTARAVLAIAFGRSVAALDTNIQRVVSRAFARPGRDGAGSGRGFQAFADGLVPREAPATWTHALMDVGATFCRKTDPRCDACPVASLCSYARAGSSAGADPARHVGTRRRSAGTGVRSRHFTSTNRWLRGRLLDALRDAPPEAWVAVDGPLGAHPAGAVVDALAALEREGFLERNGDDPRLARLVTAGR